MTVFSLNQVPVRGRLIRSSDFAADVLKLHQYPDTIGALLRETMMMSALFASLFKFEGIFSIQVNGNESAGLKMLACDVTSAGDVRAYASFDAQEFDKTADIKTLVQGGHIILTVDNMASGRRYQGIVEIKDNSVTKSFIHYFNQSEQVPTSIQYFTKDEQSCALILQHLPEEGGDTSSFVRANELSIEGDGDDWNRIMVLAASCTDEEVFDPNLSDQDLLFRLFHEEGVRVFDPLDMQAKCRCSAEKAERALYTLSKDELYAMAHEDDEKRDHQGKIVMNCEFCNSEFVFDPEEIASKM